jgi:hypothetical protein
MNLETIEGILDFLRSEWTVARGVGETPDSEYAQLLGCSMRPLRQRDHRRRDSQAR